MKERLPFLTLVTNKGHTPTVPYLQFIETCVKAGLTCVQLREKLLSPQALLQFGCALKRLLNKYNIPLIVNDDVDLCAKLDASGVHLGQSDTDIIKARSMLGKNKIIGLTTNTLAQVKNSNEQPIDYIGISAVFPTKNKSDVEKTWGLEGLKQASLIASNPIIGIGGINESNASSVMQAGANGIAAISAFHDATEPYLSTQKLRIAMNTDKYKIRHKAR